MQVNNLEVVSEENKNQSVSVLQFFLTHIHVLYTRSRTASDKLKCLSKRCILLSNNCIAGFTRQTVIPYRYRREASGWFKRKSKPSQFKLQ